MMFTPTKLIVGLGNPGPQYETTKHNLGFWVVNKLLLRLQLNRLEPLCKSLVARTEWHGSEVIFAKPMTYMNNSGQAVSLIVQKFGISPQDLCVVYDDLNLDIGVLRLRKAGSDGGHNGMKSIIRHLSTQDFPRLRVGIGQVEGAWMDHVLTEFSADEREHIDWAIPCAADALETFVREGIQTAMNRFNGRVPTAPNS